MLFVPDDGGQERLRGGCVCLQSPTDAIRDSAKRNSPDLTDAAEGTARGGSAAAVIREFQLGGVIF